MFWFTFKSKGVIIMRLGQGKPAHFGAVAQLESGEPDNDPPVFSGSQVVGSSPTSSTKIG